MGPLLPLANGEQGLETREGQDLSDFSSAQRFLRDTAEEGKTVVSKKDGTGFVEEDKCQGKPFKDFLVQLGEDHDWQPYNRILSNTQDLGQ